MAMLKVPDVDPEVMNELMNGGDLNKILKENGVEIYEPGENSVCAFPDMEETIIPVNMRFQEIHRLNILMDVEDKMFGGHHEMVRKSDGYEIIGETWKVSEYNGSVGYYDDRLQYQSKTEKIGHLNAAQCILKIRKERSKHVSDRQL